jgi:hypothetical protein
VSSDVSWPDFSQTIGKATLVSDGLTPALQTGDASVYTVPCYRGILTWGAAATIRGDWHDLANLSANGATDEVTLPPASPSAGEIGPAPRPSYSTLDPRAGWVPLSALDAFLPSFGYAFGDVALTRDATADDLAPFDLAAVPFSHFRWERADVIERQLSVGPVAVWDTSTTDQSATVGGPPGPSHAVAVRMDNIGYHGAAPPPRSLVVLHQRDYGAWRADLDGRVLTPHLADGFAVGWFIDSPAQILSIEYAAPPMWLVWSIAIASLLLALTLMLGRHVRSFPGRRRVNIQ